MSLPNDVACNKQFPSPLVNRGYNLGQGNFLLTHQLRRSKKKQTKNHSFDIKIDYLYSSLLMLSLLVYPQDYP